MSPNNALLVPYNNPFVDPVGNQSTYGINPSNEGDKFLEITDNLTSKVIDFGARYKFTNFERQVDLVATATTIADKTVFTAIAGLQIGTIANQLLHLGLGRLPYLWVVPIILRIVATPISFFFIGVGLIEGFAELIQVRRTAELLQVVQKGTQPMEKLAWFGARYFSLQPREIEHISAYINKWLPTLSKEEKAERFDRIATKILKIKYEQLERRVTPKLAKAINIQLDIGFKELANKATAENGINRLKTLFESTEKQAKVKIISHTLLIIAITVGLIGSIAATGGFSSIPLMICVAAIITTIVVTKFLIDQGIINRAVINLYNRLDKLNLLSKECEAQALTG